MLAINAYEKSNRIPSGYINYAIVQSFPNGAWGQIERGEIPLDDKFYETFTSDLSNPSIWTEYCLSKGISSPPHLPSIDGKYLFWEMMRVSREFDPYVAPAIRRIRDIKGHDGKRKYIVGALTNDYQLPEGHEYSNGDAKKSLRELFDVFISSSAVGMRKPEKRIYEYAVDRLNEGRRQWYGGTEDDGVKPSQVVFLDDIGMNLKGAREVGLNGVKVPLGQSWKAIEQLEEILELGEGTLFDNGVVEKLKREGKWSGSANLKNSKL